ncbi:MAG: glycosyltransferase family 4 protein [Nitrospirota bacterium]
MKRILFIYQDEYLPSSRIRVLNLLPELKQYKIFPDAIGYPSKIPEKIKILRKLKLFDIVYLQKKLLSPIENEVYKRLAKKLIFDFDDAIYYRDDTHETLESKTRCFKFRHLVKNVDHVVAGNRLLADYTRQFNKNIVIVPSAVETRNNPVKSYTELSDKVIIGWIGNKGNLHHLKMLSPVFQRLSKNYKIQLNIISNDTISIPAVKTKYITWKLETQEKEIASFDIGIMPLPNNKWTEGKCGYKALQYMAAAVPPVCSDVGCNNEIVENGKEGFVVSSQEGFYDALCNLIENKELRMRMGCNARLKAEKCFSVQVIAKRLADFLNGLPY